MSNKNLLGALLLTASVVPVGAQALTVDPFSYFNVYSLDGIGSSGSLYGSDFQGVTGAAGDAYFGSFSLPNLEYSDYTLYTGGSVMLKNGSFAGSVDAGGDITLQSAYVDGDVFSGGSMTGSGNFTITGDLNVAGSISASGFTAATINQGISYNPLLDFNALNDYFLNESAEIKAKADTGVITTDGYGKYFINASSGENVFTIDAADLKNAHTVVVNGPADAQIYVNVLGSNVALDSTTWTYAGNAASANVILNYGDATNFSLVGGNVVNILAPMADIYFSSGRVTGNLIAGGLSGAGQVNLGHFDYGTVYDSVPEPKTLVVLAAGLMTLMLIRRRRARSRQR